MKASAATTSLRAQISELAKKADLIQVLLGNSVPVNMQCLATEDQVQPPQYNKSFQHKRELGSIGRLSFIDVKQTYHAPS